MKGKIFIIFLISMLVTSSVVANAGSIQISKESNSTGAKSSSDWTIMAYLDGDNNLEPDAIDDFLEMATVGSNSDINIIVQLDRSPYYDTRYGDWTSTKRYRVLQGMTPTASNAISDLGEANMGDPQTVINFANWAIGNYPADNYCFIFWDHGSGWKRDNTEPTKYVCFDDTSMDALDVDEVRYALSSITSGGANKIELIGFDACLMGMIEIGYELSNYGQYMTASEETEPVSGWAYDSTLSALKNNPSMSAEELGAKFVYYYSGNSITLSTVNLGRYANLRSLVSILASSLRNNLYIGAIENVLQSVQTYYDYDYIDLYHFAQLIENKVSNNDIKNKALSVMYDIDATVTSEKHDSGCPNSHGVSIYFPYYDYDEDYEFLLFAQDSQWDELLDWYYGGGGGNSNPPSNPVISGSYNGTAGTDYSYTFVSADPDVDDISYYVEWGDGSQGENSGIFSSGEPWEAHHTWYGSGAYIIKAKAIDTNGAESGWSYFTVTMPRLKSSRLPTILLNHFPILRLVFRYLNIYAY